MNYVVIDLEMCKVPKLYRRNYKHANETIQIGAVLLDSEFKKIATLRIFKKGKNLSNQVLSDYISLFCNYFLMKARLFFSEI